jgi:tight adherence protein B
VFAAWDGAGLASSAATRVAALAAPLRTGRAPSDGERRRLVGVGGLAAFATGWLVAGPLFGGLLAAAAPVGVGRVLAWRRGRARDQLVAAAPAVARAVADALVAGASIRGALAQVHASAPEGPVRDEMRSVAARLALGEETEAVLEALRARADDPAYDALVAAVLLQREAGGDLAGLLHGLAKTLEENARASADARVLTAQARFTALLVAGLPLGAALLGELASPGSLATLARSPITAWLAGCSLLLQVVAWLAIRRIARLER